jgi:MEDS: MEthanogen/methylotroph, DcmR Sensory domain
MIHHAAVYGSDEEFLAMAVPFARDGIAAGEPVLAVTTPANLELLARALGGDGARVDQAESAVFGHRPPQRVAAFEKYARRRGDGGRVRILAEPVWAGRTDAEVSDWQRMESGLNLLLDGTGVWMICPYDTRQLPEPIVDSARRTHPALVTGTTTRQSPGYADPVGYAASHDGPLPPPPDSAAQLPATVRLREIRRFSASQAAAAQLDAEAAGLMTTAVHETAAYLKNATGSPVTARIWQQPGTIACDLHADGPAAPGAFDGYRMPDLSQPRPDDGLWYARQFTTRLDVRAAASGIRARLQLPSARRAATP